MGTCLNLNYATQTNAIVARKQEGKKMSEGQVSSVGVLEGEKPRENSFAIDVHHQYKMY
jgi:hypothetical protein